MKSLFALIAAAGVLLVGCGGGGGDAPVPAAQTFPVESAVSRVLTAGAVFNASTTSNGITFTIRQTFTPLAAAAFQGTTRSATRSIMTLSRSGAVLTSLTASLYFAPTPLVLYGSTGPGTNVSVYSQTGALPATATVGQSGPLATYQTLASPTSTAALSSTVLTWSLDADAATTALICLRSRTVATGGAVSEESDCYRIDANGTTNGTAVYTANALGETLTFR